MPGFDGNGNYVRFFNWTNDAANSIDITASRVDTEDNGFAAGLSLCLTRDNQGKMAADFLPGVDNTYNLGTASFRWAQIATGSFRATASAVQGLGPVAGTFLDMTPDTGTFQATFTGYASAPGNTSFRWVRSGLMGCLTLDSFFGTSNGTAFAITNLPAAIVPTHSVGGPIGNQLLQDNGGGVTDAYWQIGASSSTLVFSKAANAAGWTNTGAKGTNVNGICLFWPLN